MITLKWLHLVEVSKLLKECVQHGECLDIIYQQQREPSAFRIISEKAKLLILVLLNTNSTPPSILVIYYNIYNMFLYAFLSLGLT